MEETMSEYLEELNFPRGLIYNLTSDLEFWSAGHKFILKESQQLEI